MKLEEFFEKKPGWIIVIFLVIMGFFSFSYLNVYSPQIPTTNKAKYITYKNNHFLLENSIFQPTIKTLSLTYYGNNEKFWGGLRRADSLVSFLSPQDCTAEFKTYFQIIKKQGFNTIRINTIPDTSYIKINLHRRSKKDTVLTINNRYNYAHFLNAIDSVVSWAKQDGLKTIFTVPITSYPTYSETFLKKLCINFHDKPEVIGYELLVYKSYLPSIRNITKPLYYNLQFWNSIQKKYAPYQISMVRVLGKENRFQSASDSLSVDLISYFLTEK